MTVALKSREGAWIMTAAIMASAMAFIDGTALNVVLPSLQSGLHATGTDIFWILNAYLLMLASLILVGGSLGDKLGRKKVFMYGIAIFVAGSALCGFAGSVFQLILFRLLQGLGGAFMIPGSLSLISSSIHEQERGKAIGTWSSVTTAVTLGGPILGGALGDAGLWRYIFFINLPIGAAALLILWKNVTEVRSTDEDKAIDIAGAIAIASGMAFLTFGFLRMPALGLAHPQVYLSLVAGILLFITFIFIEKKSRHAMMPLKLFANRVFSGVNLLTFFLYAGLGAGMLFLGLNLVQVQGYSQLQSGLTFLPFTLLMILLARFSGNLADKYGSRPFLIAGPAIAGTGLLLLSFVGQTAGVKDYWTSFFPGIFVFGLGMALTVAPLTATVMGSVSDAYSGVASGVNNALTRISNVFANAVFGAMAVLLFNHALARQLPPDAFSKAERVAILAQAANLGDARAPAILSVQQQAIVRQYYHQSFIAVYSRILLISALVCYAGVLCVILLIRKVPVKDNKSTLP
ncbi:MFS transporter [Taibaiella koreensis]|uniref:MFS transporter n=1 Tax=Taibaiella koreensis TaxID=1268548 RepID=UPI000E59AAA2|nr:MFS transporter [Taibaiella koreensis]